MFYRKKEMLRKFEEVAFEYMDDLYNFALYMTRNPWDAEDLVQDTYLRAYRFFGRFKRGTNFKAWIFRILVNLYINGYRKKQKEPTRVDLEMILPWYAFETSESFAGSVYDFILDDGTFVFHDEIYRALNAIPEKFKFVVLLIDIAEFTMKECSMILDCPIGTVMSRHSRAKKLLKNKLRYYAEELGMI